MMLHIRAHRSFYITLVIAIVILLLWALTPQPVFGWFVSTAL